MIRRTLVALLLLSGLTRPVPAAEPFPGLAHVEYKGYRNVRIFYDPAVSKLVDKPLNPGAGETGEPLVTRALQTRIDRTKAEEFFIDYDEGPSADPEIVVTRVGAAEPAGRVPGLNFYIPGTGAIYASGHSNTEFDTRKKYLLEGGRLVEVKQPFSWVGLESKALKDLALLSAKERGDVVARLPKGSALTVVLNEGPWYLIKTPFGLVGWLRIEGGLQEEDTIEGLFFAGD